MSNIWLDGMMGLVIGDALGNPVQFSSRETIQKQGYVKGMESGGVYHTPVGTWTDDSSMALATLDSIRMCGGINLNDIMQKFMFWRYDGRYTPFRQAFDQGGTCTAAITDYSRNHNPFICGRIGEFANGNGGLMRILPVCLFGVDLEDDEAAIRFVHDVTALTHNHPRALIASGMYYFMVKEMISGTGDMIERLQNGYDHAFRFYHLDQKFSKELGSYTRLMSMGAFSSLDEWQIRSSGYVVDTLEAAVWSLATTGSFRDALLKAVNLGDDADTVGAVAGGLAGLFYGHDAIPAGWTAAIQRRGWIEDLCNEMPDICVLPFC